MATATADIEQIIRLTARSDVKQGLEAAKRDIQTGLAPAVAKTFDPAIARRFGTEMGRQADAIKGKFAGIRQAIFNITGISLGIGAVQQAYNAVFSEVSAVIKEVVRQSSEWQKNLAALQTRLSLSAAAAGEATGRYKALAQELRTNSGLSQEFASQAVNLAQAFALDTKQIDAVAEAALVMSERFGGTFAERFLQFGLGAKGNAEALEELSKALNLAVEASDVEKVVRNLSAIARLQKEIDFLNVRQSGLFNLAGAGGQGGEQTALEIQRRLNSIRQIEEQTRIRTTAAAEAERKAVEAETEAFFEQFVEIERLNRARKEMRDLQEKGDIAAIQMEVDAKARALDGRRMGFGDGQAGQAFADANEEARQAISTYSLVRDGIDLAANSFIGLGQAAVQGSKAIKQAAISIVADVAGMIARFLALSAFSAIFGGFAPAGGAYRPSLGLEPTPRARGGYKGAGSRVKSFAGGTPFSGVTDGEMYLVGDNSNGREAVIPLPDGRRVPVEMRGGGGNTVINNYHVQTIDSQSFESWVLRSKGAVANAVMAELDERPSFRHSIRGT